MQKDDIILTELKKWLKNSLITKEEFDTISKMYEKDSFDFKSIVKWVLITGIVLLALGIVLLVSVIMRSMYFLIFLFSSFVIAGFILENYLKKTDNHIPKTLSAIIVVSSIFLAGDIFVISYIIVSNKGYFPILILLVSFIYFIISYWKKNIIVLIMALASFLLWYGTESAYRSEWGAFYLGLNYPMRYLIISPLIMALGVFNKFILDKKYRCFANFTNIYYIAGLICINVSLWLLSIFGNNEGFIFLIDDYKQELLIYSLSFIFVDIILFVFGLKYKNKLFVNYSIFFTILNLYTRYFEYFFGKMSTWGFFIVLGLVTVIAGFIAERIIGNIKN